LLTSEKGKRLLHPVSYVPKQNEKSEQKKQGKNRFVKSAKFCFMFWFLVKRYFGFSLFFVINQFAKVRLSLRQKSK